MEITVYLESLFIVETLFSIRSPRQRDFYLDLGMEYVEQGTNWPSFISVQTFLAYRASIIHGASLLIIQA